MNYIHRILIIFSFIIFYSCDKELHEDFIVRNNLQVNIEVHFETFTNEYGEVVIQPNSEVIVHQTRGFGNSVHKTEISRWFKSFEVTKEDTIESSINYLLDENWKYHELSDTQAEYLLVVNEMHFN